LSHNVQWIAAQGYEGRQSMIDAYQ